MITYTSKNHTTRKRNRREFHGPIDLEAYPITRYQRAGDDIDHPIIVDDYKIDETLKPIWSGHGASLSPEPTLYTETETEADPSHHRGLGSASCPPVLEDGPRPRSRKRYFKSASPTSTDDEGLVPVEFVPPPDSQKSVEVVIEYPPGFDEFKRTYIPAEQAGGQDIHTVPKPKAKQLNESGPSPALQPESRLKKKSKSGPEDSAKAPQKSRGNGRRKDGKTAYDIPGAKLLFDSFPEPAEEPESVAEGSRSRTREKNTHETRRSRTRSPSTHQIEIDDELLWEHVETSDDERDDERVEYYLLNNERHPDCRPVSMAPQSRYGVHPRHMQHFSDWSLNNLGGTQNHSLMREEHKRVFSHLKEHVFNDDHEAIEAFIKRKPRKTYDRPRHWKSKKIP